MMACSTLKSSCLEKTMVHPRIITDIFASIDGEVKRKINSTFGIYQPQDGESVLVQFWAAKEIGNNIYVLTTTSQPFYPFGNNQELHEYYQACLDRKCYVFRNATREAAFGLAGRVFLSCTPAQTQDVHKYHTTGHCPRCQNAIFVKMGSFAVPVIVANKCVGVLEFVMDAPRDYQKDISLVQAILEHAGLKTSIQIDRSVRTYEYIHPKERSRITYTSPITWYCCLSPLFGLSSVNAAKILGKVIGHEIPESTFATIRRNAGIPEWPCIRNTTVRASVPETQINERVSEAIGAPFVNLIANRDYGFLERARPDSIADFGGMKYQDDNAPVMYLDSMDDENSANIDHTDVDMISTGDYGFPERSSPDSMAYFGGMTYQDNNASIMYLNSMEDERSVNYTDHLNADMISLADYGFLEQTMTNDVELCNETGYACPDFMPGTHGMEYPWCNAPLPNEGSINSEEMYMGTTLASLISTNEMPQEL